MYDPSRALLHSVVDLLDRIIKRLLRMLLRIKTHDPRFPWELNRLWVLRNFIPIGLMPHIPCGLARLLDSPYPIIPKSDL